MVVQLIRGILSFVVVIFLIVLLARVVLDWVQFFARDWRPRGGALVVAEAVYTVTDPPLRALRKVIPPLRFGNVAIDLAFMVLVAICWVLLALL